MGGEGKGKPGGEMSVKDSLEEDFERIELDHMLCTWPESCQSEKAEVLRLERSCSLSCALRSQWLEVA